MRAGRPPVMAIFGGAGISPRSPVNRSAQTFAQALAAQGWTILCGGYGGVMAAVARGAKAGGGGAHGVLLPGLEGAPSPDLASHELAADLYDRLRRLIEPADCYAAFAGSAGTLNEIVMLLAFYRSGRKRERPLLLIGSQPSMLMPLLASFAWIPKDAQEPLQPCRNVKEALKFCERRFRRGERHANDGLPR